MTANGLPHSILVDDEMAAGQPLAAGDALARLAAALGATLVERRVRDEPRHLLALCTGAFELTIEAGHLYDTRETLSLAVELRHGTALVASVGLAAGVERIKLGPGVAWLRAPGGPTLILGGPTSLLEVQA